MIARPDEGADAAAALCPNGLRTMEGVGLVCPQADGMFEVFSSDLRSLGFIHGTDPAPKDAGALALDDAGASGTTTPACVSGAAGTYFIQVIYARATNDADQYATLLNQVRYLVGQANKVVDDAGIATGSAASLKVKCVSGQVEVKNEVLPTAMASASFSTIVTDLRAKGYTDGKVKYWVYYDDTGACGCGGTGHLYTDETLAVTNKNNGNQASMFAVNFGYNSTRVFLHELGHNMGAVQDGAPRSTLAGHCYDGLDIMCYNDGGPNGTLYATTYCSVEVFDCGKQDYFNRNPAAGSYLASHWNLGNAFNRFMLFPTTPSAPTLTSVACPATVETDATLTCTFVASDDSTGVRYTVNWGDSTTTTVPSSGYVAPGVTQSASHTYTSAAARTVSVSVVDSDALTGNTLTDSVTVFADPPVMNLLSCPTPIEVGTSMSCSFRAADNSSGVSYAISWGDSTTSSVPASGFVTPGVTQTGSHTYSATGTRTVSVSATDSLGHLGAARTQSVTVAADLTPPTLTVTDPRNGILYVGCGITENMPVTTGRGLWVQTGCVKATATDAKSGVNRVEVLVQGTLVATDFTSPYVLEFPVTETQTNAAVTVRAIDNAGNVRTVNLGVDMVSAT